MRGTRSLSGDALQVAVGEEVRLQIAVAAADGLHGAALRLAVTGHDGGAAPALQLLDGARAAGGKGPGPVSAGSGSGAAPGAPGSAPSHAAGGLGHAGEFFGDPGLRDRGGAGAATAPEAALGELAAGARWRGAALMRAERPGALAVTAQLAYLSAPVRPLCGHEVQSLWSKPQREGSASL